ncbi:MAG: C69 family dipeptidase [Bacteroidales bacterium]
MKTSAKLFLRCLFALLLITPALYSQNAVHHPTESLDCFTILVGKDATIDGSVMVAHNEDDYGKQLVNWIAQPQIPYHEGSELVLKNGGRLAQVAFTNRFIWLELPGMDFADSYLNEHGVTICSNSCPSKEDNPELTNGGIGYRLRGILAERAQSAREAVEIAADLINRFGYTASGRTYSISDANEAWVLAIVQGKHFVAQRVPDDQMMILANHYTIDQVDLSDTQNFIASPDLIDYAIKRGWYDPTSGHLFSFREAYGSRSSLKSHGNINRAWGAYYLMNTGLNLMDRFPFSFKPGFKISKRHLMRILRYHYEGTKLDRSEQYTKGSPYELNGSMICGKATVYGFVAELRNWLPADIGCVMWLSPQWPDIQPFIPYYAGTTQMHPDYCRPGYPKSFDDHYNPPEDIHDPNDQHAFWAFVRFSEHMNQNYGKKIHRVTKQLLSTERKLFNRQKRIETKFLKAYEEDPEIARKEMTEYTKLHAGKSLKKTQKQIK